MKRLRLIFFFSNYPLIDHPIALSIVHAWCWILITKAGNKIGVKLTLSNFFKKSFHCFKLIVLTYAHV